MRTLKEMVSDNQSVFCVRYREDELFYRTACGFEFPVPIAEAGGAEFLAQDKALLFMRYIRKEMARIEGARARQSAALAKWIVLLTVNGKPRKLKPFGIRVRISGSTPSSSRR